jgi:hypothetical protein
MVRAGKCTEISRRASCFSDWHVARPVITRACLLSTVDRVGGCCHFQDIMLMFFVYKSM